MTCQGVIALFGQGFTRTTRAERNAACVHVRTCEDCQRAILDHVKAMPPEEIVAKSGPAMVALLKDRSDPEWK